jgi:hypothetical protein
MQGMKRLLILEKQIGCENEKNVFRNQLKFTGSSPFSSAMKVLARTMSRVLTPKIFLGLYTPAFLKISAAIGTVLKKERNVKCSHVATKEFRV